MSQSTGPATPAQHFWGYLNAKKGGRILKGEPAFDQMVQLRYVLDGLCVVRAVVGLGDAATAHRAR